MKPHQPQPRRAVRAPGDGFTLTELLVVVAIIGLMMGILTPSLMQAVYSARTIAVCRGNQASIVKACSQYALSSRKKKLPTIFFDEYLYKTRFKSSHPNWDNFGQEWWNVYAPAGSRSKAGNPACLWLLVKEGHCPRQAFLCPQAKADRGWEAPDLDDTHFNATVENNTTRMCTLSYSYISMTSFDWPEPSDENIIRHVHRLMTMEKAPGTLVVLADQNPRCEPHARVLRSKADLQRGLSRERDKKLALNSPNHLKRGQNMARLDGSVAWNTEPNSPSYDDEIYFSGLPGDEMKGRRMNEKDSFLIP